MSKNKNLHEARRAKNDEFYTMYKDIEKEVEHYKDELVGKWVYCPFDDYRFSNFVKYFKDNYTRLGLKHLTATNYDIGNGAYRYDYDGKEETITALEGNGSYDSEVCTGIRDMCDVIISNPPFSKFRSIIKWVVGKKFLLLGNINAITFKEIFPYIKNNELWLGASITSGNRAFNVPDDYPLEAATCGVDNNGKRFIRVKGVRWFTNIDNKKRNTPLDLYKTYTGRENEYPKYDNYDAINVDKTSDIPTDYEGVMGVPITFLDKYCPNQFEIIGISNHFEMAGIPYSNNNCYCEINGIRKYVRFFIQRNKVVF